MKTITAISIANDIRRVKSFLQAQQRSHALLVLEGLQKQSIKSSIDVNVLESILESFSLASLYITCNMDESVFLELDSAQHKLQVFVRSRVLMRKRMERNADIGDLGILPELCLQKVMHGLYETETFYPQNLIASQV